MPITTPSRKNSVAASLAIRRCSRIGARANWRYRFMTMPDVPLSSFNFATSPSITARGRSGPWMKCRRYRHLLLILKNPAGRHLHIPRDLPFGSDALYAENDAVLIVEPTDQRVSRRFRGVSCSRESRIRDWPGDRELSAKCPNRHRSRIRRRSTFREIG